EGFAERRQLGIHGVAGLAAGAVLARERGNGVGAARTDKAQDDDQGGGEDLRATSRFRLRTHDPIGADHALPPWLTNPIELDCRELSAALPRAPGEQGPCPSRR